MWGTRRRKILIVAAPDGETGLHAAFLNQPDIQLMKTAPGQAARALARAQHPRLIVQNVGDPREDSLALTRHFKCDRATRSVPIIAVTGENCAKSMREAGADTVLIKPLEQRAYWEAVSSFIRLPRRRDLRQIVNLRFTYEFADYKRQAFSRDLSMYGAFLKTDQLLPHGARVRVHFSIPGDVETINCSALVRRSAPVDHPEHSSSGFAVEFDGMEQGDAERLEAFVRRHLRRPMFS
jgi:CheY-like chemotaxis protein